MGMWNNIFASTYLFYERFKDEVPRGSAICVLGVGQITLAMLLLVIIGKLISINIMATLFPNKYFVLPICAVWIFFLFRYYNNKTAENLVKQFKQLNKAQRKVYAFLSISIFLLPTVLIFLVLLLWK
jgi:hypothetical protein